MNDSTPNTLNKRKALRVLIQDSILMSEPLKEELLLKLDTMTEEQIMELGRFFALEQEKREALEETFLKTTAELEDEDNNKKTQD